MRACRRRSPRGDRDDLAAIGRAPTVDWRPLAARPVSDRTHRPSRHPDSGWPRFWAPAHRADLHLAKPRFGKRVTRSAWQRATPAPRRPLWRGACSATASPRVPAALAGRRARGSIRTERSAAVGSLGRGLVVVGAIYMKVGVPVIVHDLVSPEKPTSARFTSFGVLSRLCLVGFTGPRDDRRTRFAVVSLSGRIPSGGTRSKFSARRAGVLRVPPSSRPLSTGVLHKAARMIYISYVRVGR